MTCLEYCPNEFPLQPYNVVNYTDLGQTMINGVRSSSVSTVQRLCSTPGRPSLVQAAAEHWQQVDCLTEHC